MERLLKDVERLKKALEELAISDSTIAEILKEFIVERTKKMY